MNRFFDELSELKLQQGDISDLRGKKSKRHPVSNTPVQDGQNDIPMDTINTLDPTGVPHPHQTDMLTTLPVNLPLCLR